MKILLSKNPHDIEISQRTLIRTSYQHILKSLKTYTLPQGFISKSVQKIPDKKKKNQTGYQMVSFDVEWLFTTVPLDRTIDILQRIFDNQEIQTTMTKKELRELLMLCTKNMFILLLVVRLLFNLMVWPWVHH